MAARSRARMTYQPALDGLRGVAVAAVLCFHSSMPWMRGGEMGVDLFFVLSGYLITTLLLTEHRDRGTIRLGAFWARRVRRLFPALVLLLVGVALYAAFVADPSARGSIRLDGLASLTYWSNWRFVYSHQSYFAHFALPSPLRHMWSLSVEEQWYLLWPPLVIVVVRAAKGQIERLVPLLGALAVVSVALMAILGRDPTGVDRAYYGTDTRLQTLLIGALLAVVLFRWPVRGRSARSGVQALGLVGAVCCGWMLSTQRGNQPWMFRGGYALFALAGASVVAAATMPRAGVVKRALRWTPLVWLGRISYGLYLWHWPINVWMSPPRVHLSRWPLFGLRTAEALAVATLSFVLVEQPIRLQRVRIHRPRLALASAAVALVGVLFAATLFGSGGDRVLASPTGTLRAPSSTVPADVTVPPTTVPRVPIPPVPLDRDVRVMVVGDSTAWTLSWGLPKLAGLRVNDRAHLGCGLLPDARAVIGGVQDEPQLLGECVKQDQLWLLGLAEQPDVVLMSWGAWEMYDQYRDGKVLKVGSKVWRDALLQQFQTDIDFLNRYGLARIAVLDVPCFAENDPALGGPASDRNDPRRLKAVQDVLAEGIRRNAEQVTEVPISEWLCPNGVFQTQREGIVLRPDGVHVGGPAVPLTWQRWLGPRILAIARTERSAPATGGAARAVTPGYPTAPS